MGGYTVPGLSRPFGLFHQRRELFCRVTLDLPIDLALVVSQEEVRETGSVQETLQNGVPRVTERKYMKQVLPMFWRPRSPRWDGGFFRREKRGRERGGFIGGCIEEFTGGWSDWFMGVFMLEMPPLFTGVIMLE